MDPPMFVRKSNATTNDPSMQNTEIYVLITVTDCESCTLTEGTARKLMSTASITVD